MLQFITKRSERFTVAEEAQMAIEGGCRWIQLSSSGMAGNEDTMRETALQLIELCKEQEAFLLIENDVNLVEELKVHGVFLHDCSRESVMTARERLGAEAVLGVGVGSVAEALHLVGLDVDYITLPVEEGCADKGVFYAEAVHKLMEANIDFHVVATGNLIPADFAGLLKAGCSGVAVSDSIIDASDPVDATRLLLAELEHAREEAEAEIG